MVITYGMWAEWLTRAEESVRRVARQLADESSGPLSEPARRANWDIWRGAAGDHSAP